MFTVDKQIRIDASPADVFSFIDDPRNHVKITPSLIDVENVEWFPDGGKRAKYRYKLAGVKLSGHVEDVERSPGERLVQKLTGAIEGTIAYDLADVDAETLLEYGAEYSLPDTVLDTVLHPVAKAYNRREAEATLQNLKTQLETQTASRE